MRSTACRRRSGLTSFPGNVLEHLFLKRQIGDKTLQADILAFQVLHPLRMIDLKTAVFLAPAIKTLQRYARIPAGHRRRFALCHRHFNLTKQRYDLLRAKPLLRHDQLLSKLFSHNAWSKKARSGHPIDQFCRMKVCDLAHQLVSGLLRIRGIEDWLRFAFACRHEASARIAVNFGGWRAAHAQRQSAKRSQFRPSMRNEAKIIVSSAAPTAKTYR